MRIDGELAVTSNTPGQRQDRRYSAARVIAVLDGAGGGGTARTTITATYSTTSVDPTVYYTALNTDGSVLVARTTSGVTFGAVGMWEYAQSTTGITDFVAVWDEGNVDEFASEWIVVDT